MAAGSEESTVRQEPAASPRPTRRDDPAEPPQPARRDDPAQRQPARGRQPAETRQLESLVGRLLRTFPELGEAEIREAVLGALHGLDGARLRQFVPVIVERDVMAECRRRRAVARARTARADAAGAGGRRPAAR